ncbi:MAG: hypothetical protein ACUVXJ_19905 [Phycisphaerae bacterium]
MNGDKDIGEEAKRIQKLSDEVGKLYEKQAERSDRLDAAQEEIERLASELGADIDVPGIALEEKPSRSVIPHDLAAAIGSLDEETRLSLDKEFLASAPAVPPLDDLDRFVVISVGCLAALSDFVMVGLPPPTKWTPRESDEGGVVRDGLISKLIKKWNVDSDNWLARQCKVPYDRVNLDGLTVAVDNTGFPPHIHRVLTFGHDPSVFGFLVGMVDIVTWSLTGTDIDGHIIHLPIPGPKPDPRTRVCLAPLLWLGHLVSDVATKQGIPIPGSSIFRLCRIPVPGASDDATLSDATKKLYIQGYDFRQYVVGGVMVSGIVEGFIRLYDWMRFNDSDEVKSDGIRARLAENYVADARKNSRLASRLFWTHAIASGANAGRISIQAATTQDFFSAARNVNLAEWKIFGKRTIEYIGALARETDLDQALANRQKLEERWDALLVDGGAAQVLYMEPPADLHFEKVTL